MASRELLDVVGLGHADRRAHVRRLDEARQAELGRPARPGRPGVISVLAQRPERGLGDAVGGEHLLGHRLVHRQRRAEHAGPDVGGVGQLEQPLHGAVLAHRAVQQRQHDGDLLVVGVRRATSAAITSVTDTDGPVVSSRGGERRRTGGEGAPGRPRRATSRRSVEMPIGVTRYFAGSIAASTCAAVTQLTSCSADWPPYSTTRWTRLTEPTVLSLHVSTAAPSAEPDATDVAADSMAYRSAGEVPGVRRRRGDRRPAGRRRRRARRAPRSTPGRCARASCSCRSSPTATATSSSPPRSTPAPAATLTSRAVGCGDAASRRSRSPTPPRR